LPELLKLSDIKETCTFILTGVTVMPDWKNWRWPPVIARLRVTWRLPTIRPDSACGGLNPERIMQQIEENPEA
jgi:hypothetical protein